MCGIHFKYPSKLNRHLQTAKHRLYEANYCGGEVSAAETNTSGDGSDYDGDTFSDTLQEPTTDTNVSILKKVNHVYTLLLWHASPQHTLIYIHA